MLGAVVRVVHFPFHLAKGLGVKISKLAETIICESSEIWLTVDLVDNERRQRFVYFFKPTFQHDCFEMICVTSGF